MLIHPSYRADARRAVRVLSASTLLLLVFVAALWLPAGWRAVGHFQLLHIAAETLSVAAASLIFGVIWSSRREGLPGNLLLLGSTFLGVAVLDFLHLVSYPGMPDFVTSGNAEKAIYFWFLARLFGALGLLAAAWLPWRESRGRIPFGAQAIGVLALVAALTILYFQSVDWIPRTFVPGQGLTPFKILLEYCLITLYLVAAARLWRTLKQPRRFNAGDLLIAAVIMAQGEYLLTLYSGLTDIYLLAGHLYKVLAYVFLYRAVFAESVQYPYALLRDSREQLRATLDALPDLVFEMDLEGRYLGIHTSRPGDLSLPADQLIGKSVHDIMSDQDSRTVLEALREAKLQGQSRGRMITLEISSGGKHEFELSVARKAVPLGHAPRFAVISRDVTARLKSEQALRTLSTAVVQSPGSIIITDRQGRIEFVNEAFTRISGYTAPEVRGRNLRRLKPGRTPAATIRAMWAQLAQGKAWRGEWINLSKTGREYIESVLIYPVRNAQGEVTNYLAHNEDVTEKRQALERIRLLSHYDQLTGLPNRILLRERFEYAIGQGDELAVLWIDLDHFKAVNDSLGHHVGDALLQEMARRLRAWLSDPACLSRYSGDDFVAILPGADRQRITARSADLLQVISRPLRLAGQDIFMSASVGIACYPDDAVEFDVLLKSAETAMYRAKEEGRNRVEFFTPEMQVHVSRELALVNALKQAVDRGELSLVYQPQVSFLDGGIRGAEALLRWDSPQWGRVTSSEFIPIAEASGLIISIGDWVLETALRQLRQWLDRGLPAMTVSVNLSAVQFTQHDLSDRIRRVLEETRVPAELLQLELTEAVAMKSPEMAAQRIEELARFGVRFAIDDFGTGYSSLSYLKRFRLHELKIDQSFVRDIDVDPDDQAIAAAIIQLSRSLGLRTVAEGVETVEQIEFLRGHGCDEAQGYYYSRPLKAGEFEAFVRRHIAGSPDLPR